jgi:ABC-2 type transport system ATP-binding protein
LIQDGKILEIDTPEAIVNKFPKTIYNVGANNMYKLIQTLQGYEHLYSVFPFGEFVHYTDKRDSFENADLKSYLEKAGLTDIHIEPTLANIEDAFMELAR